jgi:hypothetical protein
MGNDPNTNVPAGVNPNSPMITGGVPTQTPDSVAAVPNAVTPNPNPSAPNAPVAPTVTPNPTPNQPNQSTTALNPAPTPHEALYSKFLKMLNPPVRYVDENGVQQSQPQTGKNIGNNVLAAVLAGMMSPTKYREGAYGPVVDSSGTAAGAFAAGQKQKTDQNDAAQKLSVDMQTRKLATVKNNVDMMHLWAATSHEMGQDAQAQVDNYAPTLKIAQDHDQNLQAGDTKAVLASGMTMAEAMKHPEFKDAMTSHSIIPDGVIQVDDGQGHMVPTPTFSVIDPHANVSMDQASIDILNKINPQWGTAFEKSGGSMKMRLGQIQAVTTQVNSVQFAERLFNDAAQSNDAAVKALGLKGDINGEIMSAVRRGSPGAAQALKSLAIMENAKAAGGSTIDALDRLVNDPDARAGSQYILNALGTTSDKVSKFVRDSRLEQERQEVLAKEGGMGEKAPAAQPQIQRLVDSINTNPDLSDSDRRLLKNDVPEPDKNGVVHMNQGQVKATVARVDAAIATNKGIAERNALANGDPATMKQTADDIIGGDFDDLAAIASKRGNALQNTVHATHAEAERRGLDTTQFSESALRAKANMWQDYSGGLKTPTGKQLTSFDALLGHLSALDTSMKPLESKTLGLTHQPIVNMAMKDIAEQLTDDKDWKQFEFAMEPVKQEMANFLAAGYAVKAEDAARINSVLNDTLPLNQLKGVMTQMAHTADVRLAALGKAYVNTMGTTYPNLVSTDGKNTLKNLGVTSQADAYSQTIPRGWVGDQPTRLDPKVPQNQALMKQILGAAGNDPAKALNIAKLNGYIF